MNRFLRPAAVVTAFVVVLALAALHPALVRREAWLVATWTRPYWLLGLLVVPVVLYVTTWAADARVPRMRVPLLLPLASGPKGARARLRDLPGILRSAALVFGILAMARPQDVLRGEQSEERGIDIVLVLDLSGSMKAVMDSHEEPSASAKRQGRLRATRLDVAKDVITDFIARRKTDRIGIVVFGKAAYVLAPPTLDYSLLTAMVSRMELDLIDGQGTAIGDAVGVGTARLRRSTSKSKAVVLLTDGDNNAGALSPDYAAHLAQAQGVRIYTVQIGNGDDVEVQDGTDLFGQPRYVRAHFPVNPELLKKIAQDTDGESFVANDKASLEASMHRILDSLEKSRILAQASSMEDLFPFLLFPAVLLVVLEALCRVLVVRRFP